MHLTDLIAQGFRFGLIGIVATFVHVLVFISCIELLGIEPLWANFPAFSVAIIVGFIGHFSWTFKQHKPANESVWSAQLVKFVIVSLFGFGLNSAIVFLIVNLLHLPYWYAVLLML